LEVLRVALNAIELLYPISIILEVFVGNFFLENKEGF
jgi:hypothetical protein